MKKILKSTILNLGYEIRGTRYVPRQLLSSDNLLALDFDHVVCRRMIQKSTDFQFIQIGAFDGVTTDPLRKYIDRYRWRGVMVEPQARAVAALRVLYQNSNRIAIIQAALDKAPGMRTLFTIVSEDAPAWVGGVASFDRNIILKHATQLPGLDAMIHREHVACVTFEDVFARLESHDIDLLQVDTEGADAYILSLFPLQKAKPAIIHWEVKHLSKADREACLELLGRHGYQFASTGAEDMIAVLRA